MSIKIRITGNRNKTRLVLPVVPEKIQVREGTKDESINLAGLGEVLIAQDRPAVEYSFSSFFPGSAYSGCPDPPSPKSCVKKLENMKASKQPVKFIVSGMGINVYCRIVDLTWHEQGGDVDTIYYTLKLKTYKKAKMRQVEIAPVTQVAQVTDAEARVDNGTAPNTYEVQKHDCLWNIAARLYGSGSKYPIIYEANKALIGSNPNIIHEGQVLTIPAV